MACCGGQRGQMQFQFQHVVLSPLREHWMVVMTFTRTMVNPGRVVSASCIHLVICAPGDTRLTLDTD